MQEEFGSFDAYVWRFVGGETIQNEWRTMAEIPAKTPEAERMSADLKKRGFRFVGPTICYAHMQATGMVNDHTVDCFRYEELRTGHPAPRRKFMSSHTNGPLEEQAPARSPGTRADERLLARGQLPVAWARSTSRTTRSCAGRSTKDDIKARLLGHWGTCPGLNLVYVHLNRVIKARDLDVIYVCGPGHGGPGHGGQRVPGRHL